MKKFNWLFLFLFAFAFVACDDDDEVDPVDVTDPMISITSPVEGTELTAGTTMINVVGTVTDDMGLDEITISATDPSGTPIALDEDTISDFLNDDRSADIDFDIELDADAAPGTYTIMVMAVDDAGNEAEVTRTVTMME